MIVRRFIKAWMHDSCGSMAIETAIVAPVLVLLALGTFEASTLVSRQHELQSGAAEGEIIAMAAAQGATTNVDEIRTILADSLSLPADKVKVERLYRCDDGATQVSTPTDCASEAVITSYVKILIEDTYTPLWTQFGVGGPVDLAVERMVVLT